jgi:putative endonuclease
MPRRKKDKKRLGDKGEIFAIELLKRNGYRVIAKNYREKFGEIDLIALDSSSGTESEPTLVFIEVKTRTSDRFGCPEESVSKWKLRRIKKAGQSFIKQNPHLPVKQRIDVVALIVEGNTVVYSKIINVD